MSVSATTNGIRPGVCLSTAKPSTPFVGQVIYMSDTNETAVWQGSYWEGLDRTRDRNVVINGAMQVAQRGTSTASITANGYFTGDRWKITLTSLGTWTQSIENDAPTGSGFRKSLKMLCTTADASPAVGDEVALGQVLEGQNLQQFLKGTSSAKQFTLSFWVKANVTGTYVVWLYDGDNNRQSSLSYTISASATWEKKTLIFAADTTGAFDNDNAASLYVRFYLGAGSDFTSGSLATTWASVSNANRAPGQTNLAAATNNFWQVTGVQLEAGSVATPFEFEDYGTTLAKCQRYYFRVTADNTYGWLADGKAYNTGVVSVNIKHPVTMRAVTTAIDTASAASFGLETGSTFITSLTSLTIVPNLPTTQVTQIDVNKSGAFSTGAYYILIANNSTTAFIGVSAEL